MYRDDEKKDQERIRRLRVPEKFRDYRVTMTDMPGFEDYDVIYDIPRQTIWLNTSARPGANLVWLEPLRR
jgi:hypothetical protein